ncbi:MAG: hypothetical protein P9E67_11000 [Candidatus Competibacter sp.]|nr:hypothetical protein [Candidatus Competibacter sp.]
MRKLWPPLTLIENELFAPSAALIQRWRDDVAPPELAAALTQDQEAPARREALEQADRMNFAPGDDIPVPPIPDALRDRIRRRVVVRQTAFSPIPTAGQILRIDEVIGPAGPLDLNLPRPLAVLIAAPTTRNVWWGWLVAPGSETDYATFYDLLLGPEDEPCDPLAGMVQLWNPVHVYLPSTSRVLAELKPERMAAVRALDAECATMPPPETISPQPGEILVRQVGAYTVRTGTPYGDAQDPRLRYQTLYEIVADDAVKAPAKLAVAAARSPLEQVLDALRDWATDVGALLEPYTPVARSMAGTTVASPWDSATHYDLDGTLRLRLWVDEANRLLHLRLECRADLDLRVQLQEDGETVQTARLRPDAPLVELSADLAKTSELLVSTTQGELRYRLPLNKFDE